jgi:hypothetical protein
MDIIYKIRTDADYYKTVTDRYYQQRPFLFKLPVQFGLLSLGFVCWYVYAARATGTSTSDAIVVALIIGALILFGGIFLTKWGIHLRFKRRADYGTEATVTMSEAGIAASGQHVQGKWEWGAYPNAVRFTDGILLYRPGVIRWLPDAAVQGGTPDEATALVGSKTALRRIP